MYGRPVPYITQIGPKVVHLARRWTDLSFTLRFGLARVYQMSPQCHPIAPKWHPVMHKLNGRGARPSSLPRAAGVDSIAVASSPRPSQNISAFHIHKTQTFRLRYSWFGSKTDRCFNCRWSLKSQTTAASRLACVSHFATIRSSS